MKTKTINLSLPGPLLKDADRLAKKESRSRSELFREALRTYLLDRELAEEFAYGERKAKEAGIRPEDLNDVIADVRAGR